MIHWGAGWQGAWMGKRFVRCSTVFRSVSGEFYCTVSGSLFIVHIRMGGSSVGRMVLRCRSGCVPVRHGSAQVALPVGGMTASRFRSCCRTRLRVRLVYLECFFRFASVRNRGMCCNGCRFSGRYVAGESEVFSYPRGLERRRVFRIPR